MGVREKVIGSFYTNYSWKVTLNKKVPSKEDYIWLVIVATLISYCTCIFWQRPPRTFSIGLNVLGQDSILLRCPPPLLQSHFLTTRSPPHVSHFCNFLTLCLYINTRWCNNADLKDATSFTSFELCWHC